MKKRTKTAVAAVALVALGLVVPTAASADTLSMGYARERASDVAIDWYLADPDGDGWSVNDCWRYSAHKVSCDANISATHYGDLHCGTYSCHSTDTIRTCWKRVFARLSPHWQAWKVRYSVGASHCTTRTDTDYY
jgi:hypothetical protein